MDRDTAHRSFVTLLVVALSPLVFLLVLGCGPLAIAEARFAPHEHHSPRNGPVGWWGIVFLALVAFGAVKFVISLRRQLAATRRLVAETAARRLPRDPSLTALAAEAGIKRVDIVDADEPYCFTYGMLAPRVAVSRALLDGISATEMSAVLAHERYHVRNRDPLKVVVARSLPSGMFYLPVLRPLLDRYLAGRELAADRFAVSCCGQIPLVGALYKVAAGPSTAAQGATASIGGEDLLEARLAQLEEGHEPPTASVSRHVVAISVAGLMITAAGLGAAITTLIGDLAITPLPYYLHHSPTTGGGLWLCLGLCLSGTVLLYRWLQARCR